MTRALALLLLATPTAAQEVTFRETADGITALYQNELTYADPVTEVYKFQSSRGLVSFLLTRTPNDRCPEPCPDTLDVLETPPGTVAVPPSVELPEGATTEVRIIEFTGL